MNIRWRIVLPIVQIPLALALHFYGFFEYRAVIHAAGSGVGMQFHERHWPALSERILRVLDFPVMTAALPVSFVSATGRTLFEYPEAGGGVFLTNYDLVFFFGVGLLWFWIGWILENLKTLHDAGTHRGLGTFDFAVALFIGILCLWASTHCLFSRECSPPFKQISAFGLVWPAVCVYVIWRFRSLWRVSRM